MTQQKKEQEITKMDDKESNITSIDISEMNEEQLHEKLYQGYADYKNGKIQIAEVAFVQFRNSQCKLEMILSIPGTCKIRGLQFQRVMY